MHVSPDSLGDTKLSFQELSVASQKAANLLRDVGATRVACLLPTVPEWWIINLATIRAGILLAPSNPGISREDIMARVLISELDCIIGNPEVADKVDSLHSDLLKNVKTKILVGGEREETGWLSWETLYERASPSHEPVRSCGKELMQV